MLGNLSRNDLNTIKTIKKKWDAFKFERNRPYYQGKVTPNWMTMNEREYALDQLFGFFEKLSKGIL